MNDESNGSSSEHSFNACMHSITQIAKVQLARSTNCCCYCYFVECLSPQVLMSLAPPRGWAQPLLAQASVGSSLALSRAAEERTIGTTV
eukprot:COSAG02_NODE_24686_length_680_cov_1.135972_1_plen_88_part_10